MKKTNPSVSNLLNQARQLSQSGHLEASEKKYKQVLTLEPNNSTAYFELGVIALNQGQHKLAISQLIKAITLDSTRPEFHICLGVEYSITGDLPSGVRCFERALELDPGNAVAHNYLGISCKDQGREADAIDSYRKAISANPKFTEAYANLSGLLRRQGKLDAAADVCRKALAAGVDDPKIQFSLALILFHMNKGSEAAALLKTIIAVHPRFPGARNNLGLVMAGLGFSDEAIVSFRKAIENEPDDATAHNNLGNALRDQNDLEGAITCYRNALAIQPVYAQAHSNLLLALNYLSGTSDTELYQTAVKFETQQAGDLSKGQPVFCNSRDGNKRLRIGYISPDFRLHSVAHFTRKLIGAHNRDQVEVFCYANVIHEDEITGEMQAQADHWLSIVGMKDEDVVDRIRKDHIDILIDLAGHTADNRLLIFAHKPAPVQVTWLGYPGTTGLTHMDYRLTDAIADPPGSADRCYSEKLIRLPHGFLCYQSDESLPAVAKCPCLEQGYITYGSFNNLPKITTDVVRIWSRILKATPDARLILKSKAFAQEKTRSRCLEEFNQQGISSEYLDLLPLIPGRGSHLAEYSRIDIGLDTFPYNGTTTTCEALWMGVPVISLLGDRHAGRVGASILQHAGLPELLADSEDNYVERACALAADRQRLAMLREKLRPKLLESGLLDTKRFTQSLETAYRDMWKNWCDICI